MTIRLHKWRWNEIQDFDIAWLWEYYESDERDQMDTALGNKAAWATPDEVQAGLYIVAVEDSYPDAENPDADDPDRPDPDDPYTYPEVPQTGDSSNFALYLFLMLVGGVLLLLLLLERRKEKQCKKS